MYDPVSLSLLQRQQWYLNAKRYFNLQPPNKVELSSWTGDCLTTKDNELLTFRRHYHSTLIASARGSHYFVEERFKQLAEFAAEGVPADTVFDATQLPTPTGWACIQGGVTPDKQEVSLQVLAWYPARDENYQLMFMKERLPNEHELDTAGGELLWTHFGVQHGHTLSESLVRNPACKGWLETAFSLLHLMGQRLAVVTPTVVRSNVIGQLRARGLEAAASPRIVMLRRAQQEGQQDAVNSGRQFNCQWHVRGHWRRQPYKSTGEVRPVFIEAYIKGPEDKPLKPLHQPVFIARR